LTGSLRLLFLVPHVPALHAPHGGGRSTAQLIRALARRHEVAVLCLRRTDDETTDGDLRRLCSSYEEIRHSSFPPTPLGRLRNRIWPLVRTPGWVLSTENAAFRHRLRLTVAAWQPDIVHVAYHVMGQYTDDLATGGVRLVLTQHEPGVSAANDAVQRASGLGRLSATLKRAVWARYERQMMSRMDAVVVFTDEDEAILSHLAARTRVTRIPLGIAIPEKPFNAAGRESSLLFVGNFAHPPNVHAALRLLQSIFPAVRRQCPNARLTILGPNPTAEIRSYATADVTVTGTVSSVEPFLDDASVVVAPLWEGGGMRVKVLEALAAGKAIVASPLATHGLDVTSGHQLIIASSDAEFAMAIVKLLRDPEERTALADRARQWASTHLQWDQVAAEYDRLHDWLRRPQEPKRLTVAGARTI
jgi:glycosyltransferase involved in cell wall biosynthesis